MASLTSLAAIYERLPKSAKKALQKKVAGYVMGTPGKDDGISGAMMKRASQEVGGLSEDEVKERLKPYKKSFKQDLGYGAASAAADLVKGVFDYKAIKNLTLGDALLAMSHIADSPGYVNPLTAAVSPAVAAQTVKGAKNKITGDTVHKMVHDIVEPLREGAERRLSTELLIRENPNAGFYDYNRHRSNVYNNQSRRNH